MTVPVDCTCGQRFRANSDLAGKRVRCPSCGNSLTVPRPQTPGSTGVQQAMVVACRCGQQFKAQPELAGRTVNCPSCGAGLQIPHVAPALDSDPLGLGDLAQMEAQVAPLPEPSAATVSFPAPAVN